MIVQGETIGLFYLIGSSGEAIADWRLLGINVAERAAWTILNLKLREKLREQSIRDPLTNLFNRRHMEEALELEISRASRHQRSFVMVMMDLDYLKSFNDSYGHDAGDALLQEFARFLQSNVRKEDIACRYGGDEFVIIMPEAHLEDAIPRVETLRKGGHNLPLDFHGQLLPGITVTLGVACFPEHGKTAVELFKAADAALYSAKAKGRNQMMVAEDDRKQKL
jgi:diguanylate cyclase (GGDEF)-like protein